MKFLFAFAILFFVLTAAYGQTDPWKDFKKQHGKDYQESKDGGREDIKRKKLFLATDAKIKKHNSQKNVTYLLGHNKFSDMTLDELAAFVGVIKPTDNKTLSLEPTIKIDMTERQVPLSLDYRTDPCLPAVKNQGNCGGGWAFAATTPLEFSRCKKTGSPVVLSEQQLIDCDTGNKGCDGGSYKTAWDYLKKGSAKQSLYPYAATYLFAKFAKPNSSNTCKYTTSMIGAQVASYGNISPANAVSMQIALQKYGPISVTIATSSSFFNYMSGLYTDTACSGFINGYHSVVLVGWGSNHWIVRNSWGPSWGEKGYILMKRGVNQCSIEANPAFATPVYP